MLYYHFKISVKPVWLIIVSCAEEISPGTEPLGSQVSQDCLRVCVGTGDPESPSF